MKGFYCRTWRHFHLRQEDAEKCCNGHYKETKSICLPSGERLFVTRWVKSPPRTRTIGDWLPKEENDG